MKMSLEDRREIVNTLTTTVAKSKLPIAKKFIEHIKSADDTTLLKLFDSLILMYSKQLFGDLEKVYPAESD
jgi:hypothetical protein